MLLSTLDLLKNIYSKKDFFLKNYFFISGKNPSYAFIEHLKHIISKKKFIKKWIFFDNTVKEINFSEDIINSDLLLYSDNELLGDLYDKVGVYIIVSEKNFSLIQEIIKRFESNEFKFKTFYYLFFLSTQGIQFFSEEVIYSLDDYIMDSKKTILIEYVENFYKPEDKENIVYFLNYFYYSVSRYAYIEYLFSLFRFLPYIKKNMIKEYLLSYVESNRYLIPTTNIFELATLFFQKKIFDFLFVWRMIEFHYSEEYWLYFWQEQLWYAFLALQNKNNSFNFAKKVNHWFFKVGISEYKKEKIKNAFVFLHGIDFSNKIYGINLKLNLYTFYFFWFT